MDNFEFWDELGKIFDAVVAYQEKSKEFNKRFIHPWIRLGNVFDKNDRHREEIEAYKKALESDPSSAANWYELGNLYFHSGAYDPALEAYNHAIELDPKFGRAYSNLALTLVEQGKYTEAVPLYQKCLELLDEDKDKAMAWNRLGNLYRKLNQYDLALQSFQKADELDADNAGSRDELDEAPEAGVMVKDSVSTEEETALAVRPIQLLVEESQSDEGRGLAQEPAAETSNPVSVRLFPEGLPQSSPQVGEADLQIDPQPDESQSDTPDQSLEVEADLQETVTDVDPNVVETYTEALVEAAAEISQPAGASALQMDDPALLTRDEKEDPKPAGVQVSETVDKAQAEDSAEGTPESVAVSAEDVTHSNLVNNAAHVEDSQLSSPAERTALVEEGAGSNIEAGLQSDVAGSEPIAGTNGSENSAASSIPPEFGAELSGAEAVKLEENVPLAEHTAYEEYLKDNHETLDNLNVSTEDDPEPAPALPGAQQAPARQIDASGEFQIEMDTRNAHVWNELGNVYYNNSAYDDAIVAYSKAIELDRWFAWPYSNLALAYVQKGRLAESILLYQRSLELFTTDKDKAVSWNRLGNVYRRMNDYENAIGAYQRADELDPQNNTLSLESRFSLLGNYFMEQKPSQVGI